MSYNTQETSEIRVSSKIDRTALTHTLLIFLIREKLPKTKFHTRSIEIVEKVKIEINFIEIFLAFSKFCFPMY